MRRLYRPPFVLFTSRYDVGGGMQPSWARLLSSSVKIVCIAPLIDYIESNMIRGFLYVTEYENKQ